MKNSDIAVQLTPSHIRHIKAWVSHTGVHATVLHTYEALDNGKIRRRTAFYQCGDKLAADRLAQYLNASIHRK